MKFVKTFSVFLLWVLFVSTPVWALTGTFTNPEDSYVRSTSPTMNYGAEMELLADGVSQDPDNGRYGEVVTLVQWDVSSIPAGSTVTSVSVTFNYTDASSAPYNIYSQDTAWTEGSVTWSDLNQGGTLLGTVPPLTFGLGTHVLHASGVALVQGWVDGSIPNNGLMIRTGGTNNGIMMDSKESAGPAPTLEVTYNTVVQNLLERVAFLENLLAGVNRTGNNINFDGVNVRIRNGLGATNGNMEDPNSFTTTSVNGLGNLIVGYDESIAPFLGAGFPESDKSGSHNVVIGHGHNYSSFGGLVVGRDNVISGIYCAVSGGNFNTASGENCSISGGYKNVSSGINSSISAGLENLASGNYSSVQGGNNNTVTGLASAVSGGSQNTAIGEKSIVAGGFNNFAVGEHSTISGGDTNMANGNYSSMIGGFGSVANGNYSNVTGGRSHTASGEHSTISGGAFRSAPGNDDWVAGALFQDN